MFESFIVALSKGLLPVLLCVFGLAVIIPFLQRWFKSKTNKIKGEIGESIVNRDLSMSLPSADYKIFNNIYVPCPKDGPTEIDLVVVSLFGIFVVEIKDWSGDLYGKEKEFKWTKSFNYGKYKEYPPNPLRQNQRHVDCLAWSLDLNPASKFHSVICFTGEAVIKTPMPDNVMTSGWDNYILGFNEKVLSKREVLDATDKITRLKSTPSLKSEHQRKMGY